MITENRIQLEEVFVLQCFDIHQELTKNGIGHTNNTYLFHCPETIKKDSSENLDYIRFDMNNNFSHIRKLGDKNNFFRFRSELIDVYKHDKQWYDQENIDISWFSWILTW